MAFRPCALVPTYDNPMTVRAVIDRLHVQLPVIVVDDGSGAAARAVLVGIAAEGLADVVRHDRNLGKGAAVRTGLARARAQGFTHALQVDADGQHDLDDVGRFLDAARERPGALIAGRPVFDASAPASRRRGRKITVFWSAVETGGRVIDDPLCGYRVYPVEPALRALSVGCRMEFDPEIAVRMVWLGASVVNVATRVRYLGPEDGGVSHFRMFRDNIRISLMHTRLVLEALGRVVTLRGLRGR
jgi:polyprenyl-phospho-N-acetylgalactosaminyl synthase